MDRPAMNVIIEIDAPQFLPQLVTRLRAVGCWAVPIRSDACRVVHRQAETVDVALSELRFFANAWALTLGDIGIRMRTDG
jgi:hypothetical protein